MSASNSPTPPKVWTWAALAPNVLSSQILEVLMTDKLLFDVIDKIATITFNNPEKLNAFTTEMLEAYEQRLEECRTRDDIW